MGVREIVRAAFGASAIGSLIAMSALAQDHQHGAPSVAQASPQSGIQYGAQPIPLESLQKPPSPSGGGGGGGTLSPGPGGGGGKPGPGTGAGGPPAPGGIGGSVPG